MAKKIMCSDVVPGCDFKVEAATEKELLEHIQKHACDAHGVKEVTPELLKQVKSAIRER